MFDLSNGVVATKMLTEKAHRDGMLLSPLLCVVHVVEEILCPTICGVRLR
jgi:hypothetical protein